MLANIRWKGAGEGRTKHTTAKDVLFFPFYCSMSSNSWSQIVEGLNRHFPKEIKKDNDRSRRNLNKLV